MPRISKSRRTPSKFPFSLQKTLNAYARGATAAGVAALAAIPAAVAEVVYTPTHQQALPRETLYLDLNHDGVNDFSFYNFFSATSSVLALWVSPLRTGNGMFANNSGYALDVPPGVPIGPGGRFRAATNVEMVNDNIPNGLCHGPWNEVRSRYLALKFEINGETHFGWARLNVTCIVPQPINAVLTGYAYETVANRPIVTGQTSGGDQFAASSQSAETAAHLGSLALGFQGIDAWRRDEP